MILDALEAQGAHRLSGVDNHPADGIDRQTRAALGLPRGPKDLDRLPYIPQPPWPVAAKLNPGEVADGIAGRVAEQHLVAAGEA